MQILIGTEHTIIAIDQSRMNTYHLFTFVKTQFSSYKIDNNKIYLTYLKENHYKHLFLIKWIYSIHKKMHKREYPNLRDVLIGRVEKPIQIIIKNEAEPLCVYINIYNQNIVRFSFEHKNYKLFWELYNTFYNEIRNVSYLSNFFEISVEQQNTKKKLKRIIEGQRIVETEVLFKYNMDEILRLFCENENYDFTCALKMLNSQPNEPIDIIKKRYKKLLVKYHPDNVHQEGLDKINEYTEIFKNLQLSFEIIQKQNTQF